MIGVFVKLLVYILHSSGTGVWWKGTSDSHSVREIMYSILTEFSIVSKLVRLKKRIFK